MDKAMRSLTIELNRYVMPESRPFGAFARLPRPSLVPAPIKRGWRPVRVGRKGPWAIRWDGVTYVPTDPPLAPLRTALARMKGQTDD